MGKITASFWKVALIAIFIALLNSVIPILAVDYTVGVKTGDWVKYGEISVSWTGTGTEPQYVMDAKQMDWAKMEVQSVSGTTVSMITTAHYKNGTEKPQTANYDVKSGQTDGMAFFVFVIGANLKKGDALTTQPNAPTLNDTVTRRYAGADRSVNLLDITYTSGGSTMTFKGYWDQATGIMLELFMRLPDYTTAGAYLEESIKATETNMWSTDILGLISGNFIYIVGIVVLVVAIVVGVFIARRRKPAPTVTPTPTVAEGKSE